jgi:hypothetical protein
MFLMLLHWTTDYTEIMKAMFRWVVLVELVQNSWSFAVIGPSSSSGGPRSSSLLHQAKKMAKAIPWRRPSDDDRSIVSLEDIFLDELEDSFGPDDDARFLHQYDEVLIDAMDVLDDAGEVVDVRELEELGDEGLRP